MTNSHCITVVFQVNKSNYTIATDIVGVDKYSKELVETIVELGMTEFGIAPSPTSIQPEQSSDPIIPFSLRKPTNPVYSVP